MKRELKRVIHTAKTTKFEELLESLDRDPWGKAYKMVTAKRAPTARLKEEEAALSHPLKDNMGLRHGGRCPGVHK